MEWSYAERQPSQSLQEFFAEALNSEDDTRKFELLTLASVDETLCYAAYRFSHKTTGHQRVSALVINMQQEPDQSGIRYRVVTEYDGPEQHRCPKHIYELLTPFRHCEESPYAKAWRQRVEAWHRQEALATAAQEAV